MHKFLNYLVLSSAILLSSCSVFPPAKSNTNNYQLAQTPSVSNRSMRPITLLVLKPETNSIYNTNQIAYTLRPYEVAYFSKNHWADTPPNMLQQLIIQTLQNTHYYRAIVSPPFAGRYDYLLTSQLIELKQDFMHNPSIVRVVLRAQLTRASTGRIVAAKQFSDSQIAPENTPYGGVIAANRAVANVLAQLTRFCLSKN
jgi:cholesterol transport system auxiliary component